MVNDPVGDMIIQIKNAVMAKRHVVELPYSKLKHEVAKILVKAGYLESSEHQSDVFPAILKMTIQYQGKEPVLSDVKRKSKPGMRVYVGKNEIPLVIGGMGISILSTPLGVLTGKQAKSKGVGGELLCEIW